MFFLLLFIGQKGVNNEIRVQNERKRERESRTSPVIVAVADVST